TGPLTSALAVKLVNNVLFAVNAQTSVAALDLGRQLGVEPALLLEALRHCSSRSYAGEVLALVQDPDRFEAGLAPTVTKDVSACEVELKASGGQADLLLDLVRRGPMHLLRES
ncbi:MAG: 6-phosphogluconate dehydrogenase, NAD-binding protein, partial [Frankiales bacterium]|nr:6-phosphogluconate dehydrogenase, NAD-binding protein [Frankiales bacterium]